MATRIKESIKPYTAGIWIEITENKVINVLLRALNNLIHVNEDNELYVDLQLDAGIQPDDDFPVWVTTGEILQEDWRPQSGTILNWKTTSWDYVRLIYANDNKLYYDPWTWIWIEIATWDSIIEIEANINTKTFWLENNLDLTNAQSAYDWFDDDKNPLINYDDSVFLLVGQATNQWILTLTFRDVKVEIEDWTSTSTAKAREIEIDVVWDYVQAIRIWEYQTCPNVLATDVDYQTPYTPAYNGSPATKKYVDDGLATKQDILTPWQNITIVNNVISANIPWVLIYRWNVTDASQLPTTGQQVWDVWFADDTGIARAWDWTQWNQIWLAIDLTNYFNKVQDDTDDINESATRKFVSPTEKTTWNGKQDKIIAWRNITIEPDWKTINAVDTTYWEWDYIDIDPNNNINNTKPFIPENPSAPAWYILMKTSTGYRWVEDSWWGGWWWGTEYTAWDWIDITNHVITNTAMFEPTNSPRIWYVLKCSRNGYYRAPESGWSGWDGSTKTFTLESDQDLETANEILEWINQGKWCVIVYHGTFGYIPKEWDYYFYPVIESSTTASIMKFHTIPTGNDYYVCGSTPVASEEWMIQHRRPTITFSISNGEVAGISVTTTVVARENKYPDRVGTQTEFNQLWTYEIWVIYNIIPS